MQDAVGVDVEGHFDLRCAACCWWDAFQIEFAQALVACSHFALTLENLDGYSRLVVVSSREHLAELGRDGGVLLNHLGHHAAHGFDTQRQRGHIQQQQVLAVARQHRTLDRGADGNRFIRIHVLARILAEELFDLLLHLRHTGHTTDQNDVVDIGNLDAGVLDRDAARLDGLGDQSFHQRLQLGAGDLQVQVNRCAVGHRDVRLVDFSLLRRRQFDLGALGRCLDALQSNRVLAQIGTVDLLELVQDVVDDVLVEVFAAEEGIAVGGQHFKLFFAIDIGDFNDRDVERTAAQVVNGNLTIALFRLVQAEGQRSCSRFVDDALDVQTGDTAGIFGCLALCVVEVCRHRDHGFGNFFAEVVFGSLLHLAQHFCGDLWRRQFLIAHTDPCIAVVGFENPVRHQGDVLLYFFFVELAADQTLGCVQRVLWIGYCLALGRGTDQDFAVFLISDDGWRGTRAFRVFYHFRLTAFDNRYARVGGTQVNADNFTHDIYILY